MQPTKDLDINPVSVQPPEIIFYQSPFKEIDNDLDR